MNPYASPQVAYEAPGVEWARRDSAGLRQTGRGLSVYYYGIVFVLLGAILYFGAQFFARGMGDAAIILGVAILCLIVVGGLMLLVGPFFCLAVPAESGAKGMVTASVICTLLSIALALGGEFEVLDLRLAKMGNLIGLIGSICFMIFMKNLARFIGREDLARRAVRVLVAGSVVFVLWIGTAVTVALQAASNQFARGGAVSAGLIMLVVGLAGIIVFVMYANLVDALRKGIKDVGSQVM